MYSQTYRSSSGPVVPKEQLSDPRAGLFQPGTGLVNKGDKRSKRDGNQRVSRNIFSGDIKLYAEERGKSDDGQQRKSDDRFHDSSDLQK
jgi:hypothetical protein